MKFACIFFAFALLLTPAALAKVIDQDATIAGLPLHYKVVLPKDFDASKAYPAVLAFPPGSQGMDMVMTTLVQNWAGEAQKRGYIVIIPAAPVGRLFFEDGARVFPEFLNKLMSDYKIRDNKFHIAGMSNGGISAFYIAAAYPSFFSSVTGFPGYMPEATPEKLKALSKMCVHMHVGELDTGWLSTMQKQAADLRAAGIDARFSVERGEQHVIRALTGEGAARLFDEIERDCTIAQGARP
jgi:poly(3-hydroxybutyrate) depolymerase